MWDKAKSSKEIVSPRGCWMGVPPSYHLLLTASYQEVTSALRLYGHWIPASDYN